MKISTSPSPEIPISAIERLELERLPVGRSHLLLTLIHDGLSQPIQLPLIVLKGKRPGPVLGITSALHGNELNGIPVIHQLLSKLDPKKLKGTIVAAAVLNVPGFHRRQRGYIEGADLNHLMPGRADGNAAEVYAHRLVERLGVKHFDYLVDLHTASFGRINSLYIRADLSNERAAQMALTLKPQIVVHNPPSDFTLRGTAAEMGIPAVTVEIGNPQRFQPRYIRGTILGMQALMAQIGLVSRRPIAPGLPPVICSRSYWLYTQRGGLLEVSPELAQPVAKGETIARLTDIFGQPIEEYQMPEDGVVIGKSVDPVAQTGDRVLHLGVTAEGPLYEAPPA